MQYWHEMKLAYCLMGYMPNGADPCLYHCWVDGRLAIWVIWVDNCLIAGSDPNVQHAKNIMMELFECDNMGKMVKYGGCKVTYNRNKRFMHLTQPVMLQSFWDKSGITLNGHVPTMPVVPGTFLVLVMLIITWTSQSNLNTTLAWACCCT